MTKNRSNSSNGRKNVMLIANFKLRRAFSQKHLSLKDPNDPNGDLICMLKSPWSGGTQAILLTQMEFIEKLVAFIAPPYSHLTRYFGVLSSHSALRRRIILKPGIKKGFVSVLGNSDQEMAVHLS